MSFSPTSSGETGRQQEAREEYPAPVALEQGSDKDFHPRKQVFYVERSGCTLWQLFIHSSCQSHEGIILRSSLGELDGVPVGKVHGNAD